MKPSRGARRAGETQEGLRRRAGETQEGGAGGRAGETQRGRRRAGETQEGGAGGQVKPRRGAQEGR